MFQTGLALSLANQIAQEHAQGGDDQLRGTSTAGPSTLENEGPQAPGIEAFGVLPANLEHLADIAAIQVQDRLAHTAMLLHPVAKQVDQRRVGRTLALGERVGHLSDLAKIVEEEPATELYIPAFTPIGSGTPAASHMLPKPLQPILV